MINRILIRVKVVQMLYSYMLTRSEFRIKPAPDKNNRDTRCAYNTYCDLLLLILKLSGQNVNADAKANPLASLGSDNPLASFKMIRSLASDDDIRQIIVKRGNGIDYIAPILRDLYYRVTNAEIVKDFTRKRKRDLRLETQTWCVLLRTVIANDQALIQLMRQNPDFTLNGFNDGLAMVIDTLENYSDNNLSAINARQTLQQSLDKAYELYHALLLLPCALTRMQEERIEAAKEKYVPTDNDLNPSTRFIDNRYVDAILSSEDMQDYLKDTPISWEGDYFTLKPLLDKILASPAYHKYLELPETDFAADVDFWRQVMKYIILPSDELAEILENRSVFWNDDLYIMGTFVLKTFKKIAALDNPADIHLLPQFKDEEDSRFGEELFMDAVDNAETYRKYIDMQINQELWDSDRLAFMDIVILMTAIAEIIKFPAIPIPVTINEYVEIANYYSTPRSGNFINGMLFSISQYLHTEGITVKELKSRTPAAHKSDK